MNIKGAIFDLDGTLLDSMPIWETIGYDYLVSIGKTPREDLKEALRSLSLTQAAEYFIKEYQVESQVSEIIDNVNNMIEYFYRHIAPTKKEVKEFLDFLKERNVKMCIATASDKYLVEASLNRNGILSYFDSIITCTEVGCGKDHPAIFCRALESIDTKKEETFIFEDSLFAIKTAKKANFQVVSVYDKSSEDQLEDIKKLSDFYVKSLDEMRDYLS